MTLPSLSFADMRLHHHIPRNRYLSYLYKICNFSSSSASQALDFVEDSLLLEPNFHYPLRDNVLSRIPNVRNSFSAVERNCKLGFADLGFLWEEPAYSSLSFNPGTESCFSGYGSSFSRRVLVPDYPEMELSLRFNELWESARLALFRRVRARASSGNLEGAMIGLKLIEPRIFEYNAVIYSYLKSGQVCVIALMNAFEFMSRRPGHYPDVWTCKILLNGACKLGFLDFAFYILEQMCASKFTPTFSLLVRLLRKSLSFCHYELSIKVAHLMLQQGFSPTLYSLNMLVSSLCKSGYVLDACEIFLLALEKHSFVTVCTYNPILFNLSKIGDVQKALCLFYMLHRKGYALNVYSYSALVLGFSNNACFAEAFKVLDQMRVDGYVPTVVTYTLLVKHLCKNKKFDTLGFLNKMRNEGCLPDLIIYNVIIHGLSCSNRHSDVDELLLVMRQKGFVPDQYTICSVSSGMLRCGNVSGALGFLFHYLPEIKALDVRLCNVYFNALCKSNHAMYALTELRSKIVDGFVPNNATFNIFLKGLSHERSFSKALDLLQPFNWGRNICDLVSLNTFLSVGCKQTDASIMKWFSDLGIKCRESYPFDIMTLVQNYPRNLRISDYFQLFVRTNFDGHDPIYYCNALLSVLCKKPSLGFALEMFLGLRNFYGFPNTTSYNILIHATIKRRNYSLVRRLLKDMVIRELVPDAFPFVSLAYDLCKLGRTKDALRLEMFMVVSGVTPNISFYNTILASMFETAMLWDIHELLRKLKIEGIKLDETSLHILELAMAKYGRKRFPIPMEYLQSVIRRELCFLG